MNLDIPVFDTKPLKRYFYYFLGFNITLVGTVILLTSLFNSLPEYSILSSINTWMLFLVLLGGSFLFSAQSRKELKAINKSEDFAQKFARYEKYYKKKLVWNASSLVASGFFFLFTHRNYFFYMLLLQLALSLLFYPRKSLLSKELENTEIVFV
jgi:hypothetical protein